MARSICWSVVCQTMCLEVELVMNVVQLVVVVVVNLAPTVYRSDKILEWCPFSRCESPCTSLPNRCGTQIIAWWSFGKVACKSKSENSLCGPFTGSHPLAVL